MRIRILSQVVAIVAILSASWAPPAARADEGRAIGALQRAYQREMNTLHRYTAYAACARDEGRVQAAVLFDALVAAESVHAGRFAFALGQLDQPVLERPESFTVGTTIENLRASIDDEALERRTVYPLYMDYAREECLYDVLAAFRYARDAEITHANRLALALAQLEWAPSVGRSAVIVSGAERVPSIAYLLCTGCGRLYAGPAPHRCTCGTPATQFARYETTAPGGVFDVLSANR